MRIVALSLCLTALPLASPPAQEWRGPTVFTTPDDPTPFRRSDDIRLYRDGGARFEPREPTRIEPVERSATRTPGNVEEGQIRRNLEAGEVPAVAPGTSILDQFRRQRELQQAEAQIRRLRTVDPDDPRIRQLERELEQLRNDNARTR